MKKILLALFLLITYSASASSLWAPYPSVLGGSLDGTVSFPLGEKGHWSLSGVIRGGVNWSLFPGTFIPAPMVDGGLDGRFRFGKPRKRSFYCSLMLSGGVVADPFFYRDRFYKMKLFPVFQAGPAFGYSFNLSEKLALRWSIGANAALLFYPEGNTIPFFSLKTGLSFCWNI